MSVPAAEATATGAALFSVLLLIVGTIVVTVGFTLAFGLPAAFIAPGVIMILVGYTLGLRT